MKQIRERENGNCHVNTRYTIVIITVSAFFLLVEFRKSIQDKQNQKNKKKREKNKIVRSAVILKEKTTKRKKGKSSER